ncbi:hypothetical protein HDU98_007560 [Podochytrium sp. JEL0797]|nr:hypothetical protein HDU98_007560 [Podochytrium sp. JEL0797]
MTRNTAAVGVEAMGIVLAAGYTITPIYQCLNQDSPYGNHVLEAFFKSGQFENLNQVIPLASIQAANQTAAATTTTAAVNTTAAAVATSTASGPLVQTTGKQTSSAWTIGFLDVAVLGLAVSTLFI